MEEHDWRVEQFEANRYHLRAVAYRLLGSLSEADDAVQETWLRFYRADTRDVANLGGWLTTVVARVCLDLLRTRKSRREELLGAQMPPPLVSHAEGSDPEYQALMADSVGLALLVVLDTLAPAERLAFVLHDLFAVPFAEIAPLVGRTPTTVRQLASRARRRVRGATPLPDTNRVRQRAIVDAFLAASRNGDFAALLAVLDPDVVLRTDPVALEMSEARQGKGAPELAPEVRGAAAVAGAFAGRARALQAVCVDGAAGAAWLRGGQPQVVFRFTIARGKIVGIDLVADPVRVSQIDVAVLDD